MCFFSSIRGGGILESFIINGHYRSMHFACILLILGDTVKLWYLQNLAQLLFVRSPSIHSKYKNTHFPVAAVTIYSLCWVLLPLFSDSFTDKSCDNVFLVVLAGDNVEEFEQVQDKRNLKNNVTICLKKKVTTMLKLKSFST